MKLQKNYQFHFQIIIITSEKNVRKYNDELIVKVSHKFKSDAHIMNRRAVEAVSIILLNYQREAVLHNAIQGNKNMFLKATWEAKTDKAIIKKMARDRMADLKTR